MVIHDTYGCEKLGTLTSNYFRGALVVLLVFSVEEKNTLHQLEVQITEASKYAHNQCFFILVGNKMDLFMEMEERHVQEFREQLGCQSVVYVSAKDGTNMTGLLDEVARQVNRVVSEECTTRWDAIQLHDPNDSKKKDNNKSDRVVVRKTKKGKCAC